MKRDLTTVLPCGEEIHATRESRSTVWRISDKDGDEITLDLFSVGWWPGGEDLPKGNNVDFLIRFLKELKANTPGKGKKNA